MPMLSLRPTPNQMSDTCSLIVMKDALAYGLVLMSNRSFEAGEMIGRIDDAPMVRWVSAGNDSLNKGAGSNGI
jgi:hypothetical protein